jgi:hypothetical protein
MPKRYMSFNKDGYIKDLQKEIGKVLKDFDSKLKAELINQLQRVKFRNIDSKFIGDMLDSISVKYDLKFGEPYIEIRAAKEGDKTHSV